MLRRLLSCASRTHWYAAILSTPPQSGPERTLQIRSNCSEEQVIVLPRHPTSAEKDQYHQVIIVPTAATGASPTKRQYPQIVSFSWPDKKANKKLKGRIGEGANPEQDTYLSVFKKAVNDQLAHYKKSVIDLTGEGQKTFLHCDATLSHSKESRDDKVLTPGKRLI